MAPYPLPPASPAPAPPPPPQQLPPASRIKARIPPSHLSNGVGYKNGAVSVVGGAPHDARGLRALIKSMSARDHGEAAPSLHAHAAKLGLHRRFSVRDALAELYLARRHGDSAAAAARALVGEFPGGRDVVSCTALVTAYARRGHPRNALVDMLAKCGGGGDAARRCFAAIPASRRSVVSWNTIISALSLAGEHGEALAMFREMQSAAAAAAAPAPDDATFVAVLGACANLGALDTGRWIHAYMTRKTGHVADGVVGNAVLDMYAKCGDIGSATQVFDEMSRRDVYTYTSMIMSLAMHGRGEDALSLFATMRRGGVEPNEVTHLAVLAACCHAGLVDEGIRHLAAMDAPPPRVEHYGCVVDMLGRAGRLDEAEELVAAMPMPPDKLIWGSLLAACRAKGDVERAERLMRRRDGEGDADAGEYVLMSNTYASNGRHGKALQVRKEMRRRDIDKVPGCSLIEIDGVVHEFKAIPANSIIP
uniref:Pentacotripeptide-repeat region of PRORP domain-containing protein n=1 Tax=Leersia perrieri TaxID=77586 RepID=A0A0D9WL29_9ORYZ